MNGKCILIVDDEAPIREMIVVALEMAGYECLEAENTQQAHALIVDRQPDLILLDIMMPKLSGYEVCARLKEDEATRDIPIVMVTALNEMGDIEKAVTAGADDFLSKPVNKLELVLRVEKMLRLRHITDEVERLRRYIEEMEDARDNQVDALEEAGEITEDQADAIDDQTDAMEESMEEQADEIDEM